MLYSNMKPYKAKLSDADKIGFYLRDRPNLRFEHLEVLKAIGLKEDYGMELIDHLSRIGLLQEQTESQNPSSFICLTERGVAYFHNGSLTNEFEQIIKVNK